MDTSFLSQSLTQRDNPTTFRKGHKVVVLQGGLSQSLTQRDNPTTDSHIPYREFLRESQSLTQRDNPTTLDSVSGYASKPFSRNPSLRGITLQL